MRKIFLTAVLAAIAAAKIVREGYVATYAGEGTLFADASPASLYKLDYGYDFDVNYGVETGMD
jgi:hypothetical protein